ncbi:hypothetical protein LA080_009418 [Diaporthe eres]|nr:hypothetical protein LA080_009418 [Diaporthe eres]
MSPNTLPVFEALPVEVLGNILRQMASPEDVYSTIRASPKALGSFGSFREAILVKVLQAHLPAETFAEYLGLLHISKYEDLNYVPNQSEFEEYLRDQSGPRREFFAWENCRAAKSSGVQRYSLPRPADKKQINYIVSTYGMLKRFIRDYQSFARSISTGRPPPLSDLNPSFRRRERAMRRYWDVHEPQVWPPLSESEEIRLQRGFLRYELLSRSNAIATWAKEVTRGFSVNFDESVSTVSTCLQRWEEEEIRYVWTYVRRQYQVLVREVVAEFRCDVRRLSRKARHRSDNEVTLVPPLSKSLLDDWPYNMSFLGLPMLQQVLRSGFDDQRRFLKNTTFDRLPNMDGAMYMWDRNDLGDEWGGGNGRVFRNRRTTIGATPIYTPVTMELACWPKESLRDLKKLMAIEWELKEIGWVFWEDARRLDYLGWLTRDTDSDADNNIKGSLEDLAYRNKPKKFKAEDDYPEESMYVTKEDFQGELSAKYAFGSFYEAGSYLFLDGLRDISDWPSKKISPAFKEICQGSLTSG